jgi:tetratricopeptide (TPR) repeat protein
MTELTRHGNPMGPIAERLELLPRADWIEYRNTAASFESAWSDADSPPQIDAFLPEPQRQPLRSLVLIHCIKEEYERRRAQEGGIEMTGYLERFPELRDDAFAVEALRSWEATLTVVTPTLAAAIAEPEAPPVLPAGYRLIRELPRGGMSRLFLTEGPDGTREVLKQIDPSRQGIEADRRRFENEIKLAQDLAAKGIRVVPVSLVSRAGDQLAYTMPYCAGGSLRDRLKARGGAPLSAGEAAQLVVALSRTVQKLQEETPPIVHRDLKPENLLFREESTPLDQPLIADLGLAKVLGQSGPTQSGAALGTWVYMAPEQVQSPARVDGRADVYALGVILYECLTARRPFTGETAPEIIHRIYNETPVDPSKLVPTVPAPLDEVARKCLQKEPAHRYATARELAEDLERFLAGDSVDAHQPGRLAQLRSWARRYPKEATAYATALGALILGLVGSIWWAVAAAQNASRANVQAELALREARRADDNAAMINHALGGLVERIGRDPRLKAAGLTSFRKELLGETVGMYGELARRNAGTGTLGLGEAMNNQALLQFLLGDYPAAAESASRAESLLADLQTSYKARVALADAKRQLGVIHHFADRPEEGTTKTQEAISLYRALAEDQPSDQDIRFHLAVATVHLGNYAMGMDDPTAMKRYREALAILGTLRSEIPANPLYAEWEARTKSNLGLILLDHKKIDEAVTTQREAVATAEHVTDEFLRLSFLATCRNNLAEALEAAGRPGEAESVYRQSLAEYRELTRRYPEEVDYQWGVAMASTNVASLSHQRGERQETLRMLEESTTLYDRLVESLGKNRDFQRDRAKAVKLLETIRHPPKPTGL